MNSIPSNDSSVLRTVVFYDSDFPFDGQRPSQQQLAAFGSEVVITNAAGLSEALTQADVYVHLQGSYFPKEAWHAILQHVRDGKGLVHLGGVPFRTPVRQTEQGWQPEYDQTAYHQQLNIHEALPVDAAPIVHYVASKEIPLLSGQEQLFAVEDTWGLVLHVTKIDDHPGQGGSSGPMDAHIYPLLKGISHDGREVAAPVVLLEHTKGDFAGGRWIVANQLAGESFWEHGIAALLDWAQFAARGVTEIWVKPNYASYDPGERPTLTIQLQSLQRHASGGEMDGDWTFALALHKINDHQVSQQNQLSAEEQGVSSESSLWSHQLTIPAFRELNFVKVPVNLIVEPGYYELDVTITSPQGDVRHARQGFWGFDAELLSEGEMLTVDRDYFRKEGRPLPIVGMTYMTSDVARKYLFLPNASVWDRDMLQMKNAGINYLRTGVWTAWRYIMFVDGHPYEEVLRAIDAFILTAKRHGLELTFNFFAFTPEQWEGVNPYLDPRSVEAQKRFISAVVTRHKDTANLHWDLINEPSMFHPDKTFSGPQPVYDRFELEAYRKWVQQRYNNDIAAVQERWNMTPTELPDFAAVRPVSPDEVSFRTTSIYPKKGNRWLDYSLFTMDMHNQWASELRTMIQSIQPRQLVTVGQDEGLAGQRPSPLLYAEAVDYTTVHSWWEMDDLVWDGILTKTLQKPNLIQETGIMYIETPDGRAKRSEQELKYILERKYAYAFSTGGAGAVQWIWNINFYMHNVNESNIGAVRADGTEKPEADVSYDFGRFMNEIRDLFEQRELEQVALVYPYSNDLSTRKLARAATSKLIRTLTYELNVHPRAFGEYHLYELETGTPPKLIIVPSAHNFNGEALQQLLAYVKQHGSTLLFTGPLDLDEYWQPVNRLPEVTDQAPLSNVRREEGLQLDGKMLSVSFGGTRIAELVKQAPLTGIAQVKHIPLGAGKLIWSPLPVELNDRTDTLHALYQYALTEAGAEPELYWQQGGELPGVYGRKLDFAKGSLFIFVSEYGDDAAITVTNPSNQQQYSFTLEAERTVMFATDGEGKLLSTYRPHEVNIQMKERIL
ncbi:beta-galactosidase [Paenibacillus kandeliae]|uniref:beta-galactosidase n=1 Tax=Paenibacillus kandeliae TaxID=3231269 RepID=UPI00345AA7C9